MASLQNDNTNKKIYLRSLHTFGRSASKSNTLLNNRDASQLHASIRWTGDLWELIDHSTNGTMLNGKRVAANVKLTLTAGQKIQFAPDAESTWTVLDIDPPRAMLLSMRDGTPDIFLDNFNLLPDETEPLMSVYLSSEGLWMHEADSISRILQEGHIVELGTSAWQFTGSPEIESTADVHHLHHRRHDDALFHFKVSLNEEHISLSVADPAGDIDLGERTHHYSLLTLARRRLADAERGLDASSQGWIDNDELSRMLGVEQNHLNMQIFRVRNQIAKALPPARNLLEVIERRRCEVRFGAFRFDIMRGATLEGSFSPV